MAFWIASSLFRSMASGGRPSISLLISALRLSRSEAISANSPRLSEHTLLVMPSAETSSTEQKPSLGSTVSGLML